MKHLLIILACATLVSCSNSSEESSSGKDNSDKPAFIPGIAAVDVYGNFEKKGFTLNKDLAGDHCTYTCSQHDGDNVYTIRVLGKSASSINKVEASVNYVKEDDNTKQFIGYAASVPYSGSTPSAATQWAVDHFENGGDTTIASVRFVLTAATPGARVLALYAH